VTNVLQSPNVQNDVAYLRSLGATFSPFYARELIAWVVECLPDSALPALNVIASTVLKPHFDADAIQRTKEDVALQIEDYRNAPDRFMPEMLHSIAFDAPNVASNVEGGVARPQLCSVRELQALNGATVEAFLRSRLVGNKVVVIGCGVDHFELRQRAQELFGNLPSGGASSTSAPSVYRGGWKTLESTATDENITHVALGFEGASVGSPESYVASVLMLLLGGGNSFSTGGPGKGMYSMLYRDVLATYSQVRTCVAFNHMYRDTGLFGIYSSAVDVTADQLTGVVLQELELVIKGVSDEALSRAKNQLKGQVLMALESRLVQFEDMARQVVVGDSFVSPLEVVKRIDSITAKDLADFVQKALPQLSFLAFGPKPSIATVSRPL
jgi:mitochondrial-processing peptidase subunit alpha